MAFSIPDSSPIFAYSPGWQTGFANQPGGNDETLHSTGITNSTISFNITATTLTLLIPPFQFCTATISINSSQPIPACSSTQTIPNSNANSNSQTQTEVPFSLYSLPAGVHNVLWSAGQIVNSQQVIFWGVDATRPSDADGMKNVTVDDTYQRPKSASDSDSGVGGSVGLEYKGNWTQIGMGSTQEAVGKGLAVASSRGSSVTFQGQGSAIYLYGLAGPDQGTAQVSMNGQVVAPSINMTAPWDIPYTLLWMRTGLNSSQQTNVTLTSLSNQKISLDFVVLTADASGVSALQTKPILPFTSTLAGRLVLGLVIPIVALTILALGIYCYTRRSGRRTRNLSSQRGSDASGAPMTHRPEIKVDTHRLSSWASSTTPSVTDIFVSYDEGRNQRLSERWRAPGGSTSASEIDHYLASASSATSTSASAPASASGHSCLSGATKSPPQVVHSLPQSVRGSTLFAASTAGDSTMTSWTRPLRSLLGSDYDARSRYANSPRVTALPAYTPGENGTYETFTSYNPRDSPTDTSAGQSHPPVSPYAPSGEKVERPKPARKSSAPSSIMSVFGAPPSEWRQSTLSGPPTSPIPFFPALNLPPALGAKTHTQGRPSPELDTGIPPSGASVTSASTIPTSNLRAAFPMPDHRHSQYSQNLTEIQSPISSGGTAQSPRQATHSNAPPSAFSAPRGTDVDEGIDKVNQTQTHQRGLSRGAESMHSNKSAARPDSDVIPFEEFMQGKAGDTQVRTDHVTRAPIGMGSGDLQDLGAGAPGIDGDPRLDSPSQKSAGVTGSPESCKWRNVGERI